MRLKRALELIEPLNARKPILRSHAQSRRPYGHRRHSNVAADVFKTRNIGIIAHIDAGKTTTTERMLYYSGFTRRIGNVDEGSTVTDFLPAERARGVTIQSAAISFTWPPEQAKSPPVDRPPKTADIAPHNINLIDTPGHADFTFEVLRSLRVLDGAVCILDAVAGVEAQTEKVWYQAAKYRIPKIVYVNKLDRDGAAFGETVKQIASRLHTWPAVCQIPWWHGDDRRFIGIGDAVNLRGIRWPLDGDGSTFEILDLSSLRQEDAQLADEICEARLALVELLSEHDDRLVEKYLEADEDPLKIGTSDLVASLRRCTLDRLCNVTPVFAGASFRNMGVQPLLDAVVHLLPSPLETPDPEVRLQSQETTLARLMSGEFKLDLVSQARSKSLARQQKPTTSLTQNLEACALAFKVVHDARRGTLVYVRVYQGQIRRQSILYNTNLHISERAPQLLKMYASESVQIEYIAAGQIGVIPGLRHARTGDTLITYTGANPRSGPPAPLNSLQLRPIEVPPAVFFSSIEPQSLSEGKTVQSALELLIREDPSLQVSQDEDSGQTLLSGMGEFHLEIARDRLVNDLKAKASMGNIEIAYRECILHESPEEVYLSREQGGKQGRASCIAQVQPLRDDHHPESDPATVESFAEDGNRITIQFKSTNTEKAAETEVIDEEEQEDDDIDLPLDIHIITNSLRNGVLSALTRGINYGFPMHGVDVIITLDPKNHLFGQQTTPSAISLAAKLATKAALSTTSLAHGSALMELVMNVVVSTDEASLGAVASDISSARGGHIMSLDEGSTTSGPVVNDVANSLPAEEGGDLPRIDLRRVYAPPDPFGSPSYASDEGLSGGVARNRNVVARVPLKEMVGYLKHLRSLTGGRGTFVMNADRFEKVVGQREKNLLKELRGA